jgi:uncharacterized protein with PIN domain
VIAIDTSAMVAVLKGEAEAETFVEIMVEAERCFLSAVGFLKRRW